MQSINQGKHGSYNQVLRPLYGTKHSVFKGEDSRPGSDKHRYRKLPRSVSVAADKVHHTVFVVCQDSNELDVISWTPGALSSRSVLAVGHYERAPHQ